MSTFGFRTTAQYVFYYEMLFRFIRLYFIIEFKQAYINFNGQEDIKKKNLSSLFVLTFGWFSVKLC